MTSKERIDLYVRQVPDAELCEYCKHFYPHYITFLGEFKRVDSGRCIFPRVKLRHSYDICKHFNRRDNVES